MGAGVGEKAYGCAGAPNGERPGRCAGMPNGESPARCAGAPGGWRYFLQNGKPQREWDPGLSGDAGSPERPCEHRCTGAIPFGKYTPWSLRCAPLDAGEDGGPVRYGGEVVDPNGEVRPITASAGEAGRFVLCGFAVSPESGLAMPDCLLRMPRTADGMLDALGALFAALSQLAERTAYRSSQGAQTRLYDAQRREIAALVCAAEALPLERELGKRGALGEK